VVDETAKRRETFDLASSAPVVLADKQTWHFPKPRFEIRPSFAGGRAVGTHPVVTQGPELDELVDAVGKCEDAATLLVGAATLGAHLLIRNYDLTDDELGELFAYRPDDQNSWKWLQSVMGIATGTSSPKPGSGGAS
jgi:hypothetical protein